LRGIWEAFGRFWQVFEMFRRYLEGFGRCLRGVWEVFGRYLGVSWVLGGFCVVFGSCLRGCWEVFGRGFERLGGKRFKEVFEMCLEGF